MAKQRITGVKLTHLEARVRVIQGAGRFVFVAFCVAIGFVVVATALPQQREVEKLESKLELAKAREKEVLTDRDNHQIELKALRGDREFLEIQARDRLEYYRPGERVLKFPR